MRWFGRIAKHLKYPALASVPVSAAMLSRVASVSPDQHLDEVAQLFTAGRWAAERTAFAHEVCEMALAHTIPNAAEAAYRRGDLFEKRAALMRAWAEFLDAPPYAGDVVALRSAA